MIDKIKHSLEDAIAPLQDGASIMVSGFGEAGIPFELLHAVLDKGLRDLTIISNNAGTHEVGIAALIKARRVRKIVCSHPRPVNSETFLAAYRAGQIELECMPQGTLAERLRAAGAGLGPGAAAPPADALRSPLSASPAADRRPAGATLCGRAPRDAEPSDARGGRFAQCHRRWLWKCPVFLPFALAGGLYNRQRHGPGHRCRGPRRRIARWPWHGGRAGDRR